MYGLVTEYVKNSSRRARFNIAFMIFGSVYLAIFPTIVSAMSGYSANTDLSVTDDVENNITFPEFSQQTMWYIVDGARVSLQNETPIYPLAGDLQGNKPCNASTNRTSTCMLSSSVWNCQCSGPFSYHFFFDVLPQLFFGCWLIHLLHRLRSTLPVR